MERDDAGIALKRGQDKLQRRELRPVNACKIV